MSFIEQSISALKAYWRTAAIIDDAPAINNTALVSQLQAPRRGTQASQPEQASDFQGAPLDVSGLVSAFLEQDILCTVLSNREVLKEKRDALLRSDILILDWKLDDDGEITANFIQYCADHHSNALHMICIYTSENDLESIKQKLNDSSPNLEEITDKVGTYFIGSTYILVVNKNASGTDFGCRTAEPEKLPELLLKEFAPLVGGLLRNAVFHSIGAIRNNTHALLDRFHPEIDPAFISHRVYSKPCEDTEQHIIPLICSQLASILTQGNISQQLNAENIQCWLNSKDIQTHLPDFPQQIRKLIETNLVDIIKNGIMSIKEIENSKEEIKKILKDSLLTSFWGGVEGQRADVKLAMLMCCEQSYSNTRPVLKTGSILKRHDISDRYLICIQPPCDCVRIEAAGRFFIFAHASKTNRRDRFNFSFIDKNNRIVYLKINNKIYNISLIKFIPCIGANVISAEYISDAWQFKDVDDNIYDIIFQLNELHALRCVQECSNNLSRIGLMESDWQRRCARGEHL